MEKKTSVAVEETKRQPPPPPPPPGDPSGADFEGTGRRGIRARARDGSRGVAQPLGRRPGARALHLLRRAVATLEGGR